jgi:glycosyltransferase involved in cell wall biosynthesis
MTQRSSGRLRIAMVSANTLPFLGGVETHIHEVSARLSTLGVDVTSLTTDRSGKLPQTEDTAGYRIRRWDAYPRSRDYYISPGLAKHLRTADYDLIHIQGIHTFVPPTALMAARQSGVPIVLTFHTGGHSSSLRKSVRWAQWRVLTPLLRSANALVAVSEYEQQIFTTMLGGPTPGVRLIRNGCEPLPIDDSEPAVSGSPLLVSVGRLERYKGHHRILRAMPLILAKAPEARLVIAGTGPYEDALRALTRQLGVTDRVTICSFGPDRRGVMGKLVADANLFCLLSEYESHPVSVMEALAAGTNALVADTSGMSELGRAGLVTTIPFHATPAEVATAALRAAAADRCAPPAPPTWDDCAAKLHSLYSEVAR